MQRFPIKEDKTPVQEGWQTYSDDCDSARYGLSPPTDVIIIDVDSYKGDDVTGDIEKVLCCALDWEGSLIQETPKGGTHHAFIVPDDVHLTQGSDLFDVVGFDTRVSGRGYIACGVGYIVNGADCVEDLIDDFLPELPVVALEKLTAGRSLAVCDLSEAVKADSMAVTNDDGTVLTGAQIKDVIKNLPSDVGEDNDSWVKVCAGIKRQMFGSGKTLDELNDRGSWGYKLLDAFSKKRDGYSEAVEGRNFKRWCSFSDDDSGELITFASVVSMAGGFKQVTVNTETGEDELVDSAYTDDYVMNAGGKYVHIDTAVEYCQNAFNNMHVNETPLNSKGNKQKPSGYVEGRLVTIADTRYTPNLEKVFTFENITYLNTYRKPSHGEPVGTDIFERVKAHVAHLLEDEREQQIFLSYLAHNVQFPGKKLPWAIILQGVPGDGKSFFYEMMFRVMGSDNVRVVNSSTLEANFSGWAAGQCMTFIDELKLDNFKKYEIVNRIKPFISNPTVEQVRKGKDPVVVPNTTNYVCTTNYKDAIPVDNNDRRYCVLFSKWQSGESIGKFIADNPEHYPSLYNDMRANISDVYEGFVNYKIPEWFNKEQRAPLTLARTEMIELSKSNCECLVEDAIELFANCTGENDLNVTLLQQEVRNFEYEDEHRFEDFPKTKTLNRILISMGYKKSGRKTVKDKKHTFYSKL